MNRIKLIQTFIDKQKAKNYLEIGVQAGHCFSAIVCENKVGVDPDKSSAANVHETSDEFFKNNKTKFDVIFIDGLHHADQVEKDILNSLDCLSEGGTILMHDCLPTSEFMQLIPQQPNHNEWTGDTWKAYVKLRTEREDLSMCVVSCDWGVGIIKRGTQEKLVLGAEMNYKNFAINNHKWLNLISVQQFLDIVE